MNIKKESPEERELFERMENTMQFMSISMDDYLRMSDELALARVLIRELGDRLAKLEKPWVGLTDDEVAEIIDAEIGFNSCWGPEEAFARAIEAKLKEKNT